MAFILVQSKQFQQVGDATSWSATFNNPTVSGNLITVGALAIDSGFDVMTGMAVDDAGTNTFTSIIQANMAAAAAFCREGMLYVPNCVGKATHQITVTPTAGGAGFLGVGDIQIMEWSNMLASPLDPATPTTAAGTTSPASAPIITPGGAGFHLAIGGFKDFAALSITPDAGWTQILHPLGFYGTHAMYRASANGVGQTPGWTMSETMDDGWVSLHAVFLETVGGVVALNESEWNILEAQTNPLTISKW